MKRPTLLLAILLLLQLSPSAQWAGPLPISEGGKLLPSPVVQLTAVKSGSAVELRWQSLVVKGLSHFEVEKSSDGRSYVSLGRLGVQAGGSYQFNDPQAGMFLTYYRVQAVSDSGQHSASHALMVKGGNKNLFEIYPNPARDALQLQVFGKGVFTVRLLDGNGLLLHSQEVSSNANLLTMPVDISSLKPGTYYLSVNGETQRFLKQ